MNTPRGIEWLEHETGQKLERQALSGAEGRHLSLRVPAELLGRLEELAAQRNETISQTARRLLADGVDRVNTQASRPQTSAATDKREKCLRSR